MKKYLVPALLSLCTLPLALEAQVSVAPSIIMGKGEQSFDVAVNSTASSPITLSTYLSDYTVAEVGSFEFPDFGTAQGSCKGRLKLEKTSLFIEAQGTQNLKLTALPGNIGCWAALSIETAPTLVTGGSGMSIIIQTVVPIFLPGASITKSGSVSSVSFAPKVATGQKLVNVSFQNTGNYIVRPEGKIEIRNLSGQLIQTVDVPAFSVLPGHKRQISIELKTPLADGEYMLIPILDYEGDSLAGLRAKSRFTN